MIGDAELPLSESGFGIVAAESTYPLVASVVEEIRGVHGRDAVSGVSGDVSLPSDRQAIDAYRMFGYVPGRPDTDTGAVLLDDDAARRCCRVPPPPSPPHRCCMRLLLFAAGAAGSNHEQLTTKSAPPCL